MSQPVGRPATTDGAANGNIPARTVPPSPFDQFGYLTASISPSAGPVVGTNTVFITGNGFLGVSAVHFGANEATGLLVSATQITAVVPSGAVGVVEVTLIRADGVATAGMYRYVAAPMVTSVSPSAGPLLGGVAVTVTGSRLSGAGAVSFGGVAGTDLVVTGDTSLTVTAPFGAVGVVDVAVTTAGGTAVDYGAYTYVVGPSVTSVSPSGGPLVGGTSVTLTGSGLSGATVVQFGDSPATDVVVRSDTSITAVCPASQAGVVDVTVTTAGGTEAGGRFSYVDVTISPSSGPVGGTNTVVLTGYPGTTAVHFGANPATDLVATGARTSVVVPAGAAGVVDVTLLAAGGIIRAGRYGYVAVPTVTSVAPSGGPLVGGTAVTVTGTGLSRASAVRFGDVAATDLVVNSDTSLSAIAPAGAAGRVDVTITTEGGTSAASVAAGFRYAAVPAVTSVSPSAGPLVGGTAVTLTGSGLWRASAVRFGEYTATAVVVNSDTSITVGSPAGAVGMVDLTVITAGGTATDVAAYTYEPVPAVTSVSPSAGRETGRTTVTVSGTGLAGATAVDFGSMPGTNLVVNSDTSITAISPAGSGVVDVTVTTAGGTSPISVGDVFRYAAVPSLTSVSPSGGALAGRTAVTLTGTDLWGASAVSFGGRAATDLVVNSDTSITVASPAGAAGVVDVTVTTSGGTAIDPAGYAYVVAPTVESLSPGTGPVAGGSTVRISGTGLSGASAVSFGDNPGTNLIVSSDHAISVVCPAGEAGLADVTVTTAGGSSEAGEQFSYVAVAISPGSGPVAGMNTIVITGTGFTGTTAVQFGGTDATDLVVSATQITAVVPPGAAGIVDVTLVRAGGVADAGAYAYVAAPAVASISPSTGPMAGGTAVTLTGSRLSGATGVSFGGKPGTNLAVQDDTSITIISPPGGKAPVDVTVTAVGGTSAPVIADLFTYAEVPTIASVAPCAGPLVGGTSVAITGTGLSGVASVTFGANRAAWLTVNSDTSITVTSPAGTKGVVDLTVVSAGGAATDVDAYTYAPIPTVTSVAPCAGPLAGRTAVTLTGTGFSGATGVEFGSTPGSDLVINSDTSITAISPAGAVGAVNMAVITAGGTSVMSGSDVFRYAAVPTVASVSPSAGPLVGGTAITITGTRLSGASVVSFGGLPATGVTVVSPMLITATSPVGAEGIVDVTVTTAGGTSAISGADRFSYVAVPTVTSVSPSAGPLAGGTPVTVTGAGLSAASLVSFGGTRAAGFVVTDGRQITLTAPAGVVGPVDVTVTTAGGTSIRSTADRFRYAAVPMVTSVLPAAGPLVGGTEVTITGTGLLDATSVRFGDHPATDLIVNNDHSITATCPAGVAGTVDVIITAPGGSSGASPLAQFSYVALPAVSAISPSVGPLVGGALVTVRGTGLSGTSMVSFGATRAARFTVIDSNQITVMSPVGTVGVVDVTVATAGGTSAISGADVFSYVPVPSVTAVSPPAGRLAGGMAVTLSGTGLLGASAVSFGGALATGLTVVSPTSIVVTSPVGGEGVVDVTVTTPGGVSASSNAAVFRYAAVPTVTSVSPNARRLIGGTTVRITGTGLLGTTEVRFGETAGTSLVVNRDTSITVTSPPGEAGDVDVTLSTPGGTSAKSPFSQFSYVGVPTVASVSPPAGPLAGGTAVIVTGTGLSGATGVNFGGTPSTGVTVLGPTSIAVTAPGGAKGVVDVTVETAGGTSVISPVSQFRYVGVPTVLSLAGSAGPLRGGTLVTVSGTDLSEATGVSFGGIAATRFTVDNGRQITVTSPAGEVGAVDVTVHTAGGTSAPSVGGQFSYVGLPTVTSVSPAAGPLAAGMVVTITGSGLSGASAVSFGDNAGIDLVVYDDASMTATCPFGEPGLVAVTVTAAGGTSGVLGGGTFEYIDVPTVSGISPSAGPLVGGTLVTVTGTGLSGATVVAFGGCPASRVTLLSATLITAISPVGDVGVSDVTVATAGGISEISDACVFSYVDVPTVSGISPSAGPLVGGTLVTVTGTDLSGASAVSFGGTAAANFTVNNGGQISVTCPAGAIGVVDVTVTTSGGTSAASRLGQFRYAAVPVVSSLSPGAGPLGGGTTVTIAGIGLSGASAVRFGENPGVDLVVHRDTFITAVCPAGEAGAVDVTVTTAGGTSDPSEHFSYVAVSIEPSAGPLAGSNTVVITGSGFLGTTAVHFGANNATSLVVTATQITAVVPAGGPGAVDVTLVRAGGATDAGAYRYLAFPKVTSVTPGAGPVLGGTVVTVTGEAFLGTSAVRFGRTSAARFTVSDDTRLTAVAPHGGLGVSDVTVTTEAGTSVVVDMGQFNYVEAPVVTGILPKSGPLPGGTEVTITGTGFVDAGAVSFGDNVAGVLTNSGTSITTVSPAGDGVVDVKVVTVGGTSARSASAVFAYVAAPTVSAISPPTGPPAGGTVVTISGTGFSSGMVVEIGGRAALDVIVVSSTSITAVAPAGTGTVDVTLANADGTTTDLYAGQFTYLVAPGFRRSRRARVRSFGP